ncbi:TPM domain-containing protein [Pseudomonas indica]|uniref:TPM domain-containing protein n=1 Tax=Pseudomonas indica TaxID=137658 RepID=UPI0023F642DB|nr:TPM domain-containing protein [Pseudomonas indica]MBU3059648.1 TPM domain-containing protein [Pseudomonas indica]
MTLLSEAELQRVADAITEVERHTDAELVTVLATRADDYAYIPLLWASLVALLLPGAANFFGGWLNSAQLLLVQWLTFALLALLGRIPFLTSRLIPRAVRHWRAANLARRQFLEHNLHHTEAGTGMLIFVSEAERYVEIIVDRGISSRIDDGAWQALVDVFTAEVRRGRTLEGFLGCIRGCGELLQQHVPATHERNELPNRLIVLP